MLVLEFCCGVSTQEWKELMPLEPKKSVKANSRELLVLIDLILAPNCVFMRV